MADTAFAYLHPNEVTSSFHDSYKALAGYDGGRHLGPEYKIRCASGGIPEGRNMVAATLLAEDEAIEWLLMVDADMGFAPDALARLRAVADPVERPIVGGLCFAQRELKADGLHGYETVARPTIYDYIDHPDGHRRFTGRAHYPVNSVVRAAGTGAAMLLIHRSVFERMLNEYGPTWFDRTRGTDGSLLGEDISFFVRCGSLGIPLHIHTGVRTSHMKHLWLQESDFWSQQIAPPATDEVAVVVPVLNRPKNAEPFMRSLRASTGLARAYAVCSEKADMAAWQDAGADIVFTDQVSFPCKVNVALGRTFEPWLFLVGDDVRFRPGWLDHAQHVAHTYGAKVIGTNDLGNAAVMAGDHATHMLIARDYIDEQGASWDGPGVVCHEGYRHNFVDNEIVTAAKQRGVWQMALGSIVEHLHHLWGKSELDETYRKGEFRAEKDQATFRQRIHDHLAVAT